MSSCRLKTPSFSNSSTCFGGPQVCCVHTGADGLFAAAAQLAHVHFSLKRAPWIVGSKTKSKSPRRERNGECISGGKRLSGQRGKLMRSWYQVQKAKG